MGALKRLTAKLGIFGELLLFLWKRKLWWMIPMIIVLTQGSAIAPFIYTLF